MVVATLLYLFISIKPCDPKDDAGDQTCPCYTPDNLAVVTQDNVFLPYGASCIQLNLPSKDGLPMDLLGIMDEDEPGSDEPSGQFAARITEDAEGVKHFQCAAPEFVDDEFISEKQ